MVIQECFIIFLWALIVLMGIKSEYIDYNVFDRIRNFFSMHVFHHIPIPFIGVLFEWIGSMIFGTLSYNMRLAKFFHNLYGKLPNRLQSWYNIIAMYFELIMICVLFMLMFVLLNSSVSVMMNSNHDVAQRKLHMVIVLLASILIALYSVVTYGITKLEKKMEKNTEEENHRQSSITINTWVVVIFGFLFFNVVSKLLSKNVEKNTMSETDIDSIKRTVMSFTNVDLGDYGKIIKMLIDLILVLKVLQFIGIFTFNFQMFFTGYYTGMNNKSRFGTNVDKDLHKKVLNFTCWMYIIIVSIYMLKM